MHERTWQFKLHDKNVIDCTSYFGKRAGEVAAALNCQLVAANVVKVEQLQGNVRKIVGTALLENASDRTQRRRRSTKGIQIRKIGQILP